MRAVILIFIAAFALQEPAQPRHDKYREDPRAYCFHGKPESAMPGNPSAHPCQCALMCVTDATGKRSQGEQQACEMYCTVSRCLCHTDEACDLPDVKR